MFELASAAEKADVAVVGTDLDVLGALTDPATIRAAAERAHVRTVTRPRTGHGLAKSACSSPPTLMGKPLPSRNATAACRHPSTR